MNFALATQFHVKLTVKMQEKVPEPSPSLYISKLRKGSFEALQNTLSGCLGWQSWGWRNGDIYWAQILQVLERTKIAQAGAGRQLVTFHFNLPTFVSIL